ncbi:MAG TPA: TolC family protein, partial [Steroidobacteraceae bacterium]|nr:TolC family protein [Steroidobacteraceae bacterium]
MSPHRCKARRLLALFLLCWAVTAHAQQRLTAQQAVQLAWAQAHIQDELDASVDIARSEVVSARTWANPTLVVDREEPRGDAAPSGSETSIMLTQPFDLGGQRGLRIRAAEAGVAAAEAGVSHERIRLRGDVLRDFYAAVASERRVQAHDKVAAGLASLADVAAKRQRAGDLSGYESRRIAQASAQAQARRAEAFAAARAARTRLAGWSGDVALNAVLDDAIELPAVSAGGDLRSAELNALASQRAHAEAQAAAAGRVALPVTVGIGTKRTRQGGFSDDAL